MPLFRRRKPTARKQVPLASRQRIMKFPSAMQRPGQGMLPRPATRAMAARRAIGMSRLRQNYAMQRRSWLGIPVIGSIVEWILNFVFRGRRFEKGLKRRRPTPISSAMAKSRGKKITAEQRAEMIKEWQEAVKRGQSA